ncbi:MAG: tryptophan synthase subunit alpha [Candidatus Firestonebacteria bacterium]|nr:tryptophan synthase subunit alpha [Candidatus Firestonebacteria bacterium]
MSLRLFSRFARERMAGRKLFVPFVTAGDRGLAFTRRAVLTLVEAGADAIELGVPFSDPLADGPVIQRASQRALQRGTTLPAIFDLVRDLRQVTDIPLLLMGYLNPFLHPTLEKNALRAAQSGVDGFIVPDLPPEEAVAWNKACARTGLDTVFLVAPTSTPQRIQSVVKASTGFIYYVSVTGTTGMRNQLPLADLAAGIGQVRQATPLPILVGFGISTPAQAKNISGLADGVIVASVLIHAMETAASDAQALQRLAGLSRRLAKAVKNR